ncbi:MAG: hypothetical protein QXF07_01365 [Candidatus Micrarchaeia archaeon]
MKAHRFPLLKKTVITYNLDDFIGDNPSSLIEVNTLDVNVKGDPFILYYMKTIYSQCLSINVSMNGTFLRTMDGTEVKIQKYTCKDCGYSFDARPPNNCYETHYPNYIKEKSVKDRVGSS